MTQSQIDIIQLALFQVTVEFVDGSYQCDIPAVNSEVARVLAINEARSTEKKYGELVGAFATRKAVPTTTNKE